VPQRQVSHGFGPTVVRGIFANWLVGVAVWQANAAQDMVGKAVAIW
jgi:formate/nitrite transporter FocA (FNT family)